jgi:hypothetical protein
MSATTSTTPPETPDPIAAGIAARLDAEIAYHRKHDKRWWRILAIVVLGSFAVLLWMGGQINQAKPPIPDRVTVGGTVIMTGDDIMSGQHVWQSIGGHEVGSVWGHGAYVAPDWTADWLHRESMIILDGWAKQGGAANFDSADPVTQGTLKARLKELMRTNTYDGSAITLDPVRATAYNQLVTYYTDMFRNGHERYAIPANSLSDPAKAKQMASFFWWTAWAASTNAPNDTVTYTQNWPHEPLIDNVPPPANILWSLISIILLLVGIAGMVWYHNKAGDKERETEDHESIPVDDPLLGYQATPSQRATLKYFFIVGCSLSSRSRWASSWPTTASREVRCTAYRSTNSFRMPSRGPGTRNSASSGSRPRGSARACMSHRPLAGRSRGSSGSESTCSAARSWSSCSGRWPASGCRSRASWATARRSTSGSAPRASSMSTSAGSGRSGSPSDCSCGWLSCAGSLARAQALQGGGQADPDGVRTARRWLPEVTCRDAARKLRIDRRVLWGGLRDRPQHPPVAHRVLALVGRAPVGRGLL